MGGYVSQRDAQTLGTWEQVEAQLGQLAPLVVADKIGLVVARQMLLQGAACRVESIEVLVLQQERNAGLTVAQGVVDCHLIGIRDIAHQIREPLGGLSRAKGPLIGRRQLHNGNHIAPPCTGVPTLNQLAGAATCFCLGVDLFSQLLFGFLQLPQHFHRAAVGRARGQTHIDVHLLVFDLRRKEELHPTTRKQTQRHQKEREEHHSRRVAPRQTSL